MRMINIYFRCNKILSNVFLTGIFLWKWIFINPGNSQFFIMCSSLYFLLNSYRVLRHTQYAFVSDTKFNFWKKMSSNWIKCILKNKKCLFFLMRRSSYKCRYFNVTHLFVNVTEQERMVQMISNILWKNNWTGTNFASWECTMKFIRYPIYFDKNISTQTFSISKNRISSKKMDI